MQLHDADSMQLKLKEMGYDLPPKLLDAFVSKQSRLKQIFAQVDYAVNNNQFAAAVAALCDKKSKRQFITVPSGMGKSRIIAAVLALKSMMHDTKHFTIVFTTALLKSVDQKVYNVLQRLLDIELELVVFNSDMPL